MPTDDELDRRIAETAQSAFEQVQRSVDPATEYEAFQRRLDGAKLIEVGSAPVPHRRWTVVAAAAVIVVAAGVTALLVRRDADTDVVAPPPSSSSPSTTDSSTSPAATAASTTTNPVSALAEASPDVVAAGEQITITPAGFVQRACLDIVTATRRDDEGPRVGQIVDGRVVSPATGTAVTYPECFGEYSDAGFTFIVPATLPPGPYEMCLTDDANPSGCASVDVTPPSEAASACASDPFTPPTLADGTPLGEGSIDAEANGRAARWGATDAPNRVLQTLDTAFDPESLDAAVAAGRAFAVGRFQAAVLPVGDPPLGSIAIFLRDIEGGCLRWYLVGPGLLDEDAARIAQAWVEMLAASSTGSSTIGKRWPVGTDPSKVLGAQQVGASKIFGSSPPGDGIVVALIDAASSNGLGGIYRLVFAIRDSQDWVVTHEMMVELADDEQLSLVHEQCTLAGTYDPNMVAVLSPPKDGDIPDPPSRVWPGRLGWTYTAGVLTEQAPETIACTLAGE